MRIPVILFAFLIGSTALAQSGVQGYYRDPVLQGDTLVFAAEGDLWTVSATGGVARRLTTHLRRGDNPSFRPTARLLAFTARYEGPAEVYTMPLSGGVPERRTFEGETAIATAHAGRRAGLRNPALLHAARFPAGLARPRSGERHLIPLSQATKARSITVAARCTSCGPRFTTTSHAGTRVARRGRSGHSATVRLKHRG